MQNNSPMDNQREHPATLTGPDHPACPDPGGSCRGCQYSYDPALFDGGCLVHLPEAERLCIQQRNRQPYSRVFLSLPADDPRWL